MKLLRIVLAIGLALTAMEQVGTVHAATSSQEWAAVQVVVGSEWDARSFMAPVDGATGVQALEDAGALGLNDQVFLSDQTMHPAYLMDAIQRFFRQIYSPQAGIFPVEAINSQLDLLAVGGLTPEQEAALLTRVCTQPLATTFLQPVAVPTATPAPVSTPGAQGGGVAIFPPSATFLLPVGYGIAGPITVSTLAPGDLPGPIKPLSRTEYDVKGSTLSYRISVFANVVEATRSFQWQMAQPAVKAHPRPASRYAVPGQYNYAIPGFIVAAILFRNLEIAVSGATAPGQLDLDNTAYTLYQQAHAFAVLQPLHQAPTLDTSGPPILHIGSELIIPASIAGGAVQLGYNDAAAVYFVKVPGQKPASALSQSYSIEPLPTDLIAQATLYDHSDDALLDYFRAKGWSFTKQAVPHPALAGERAFWMNYSQAPDSYHTGGGAFVQFVYRNLIVTVEWDVAGGELEPGILRHALSIARAVVDQLHLLAHHR